MFVFNAFTIVSSVASLIPITRIQLEDQSQTTKTVVVPSTLMTGTFPVISMYIVPFFISIEIKLQNIWFIISSSIGGFMHFSVSMRLSSLVTISLVEQVFSLCHFMWPLLVAGKLSDKYFCTAEYVIPGHVVKWLLAIALRKVALVVQNKHWLRCYIKSLLDVIV